MKKEILVIPLIIFAFFLMILGCGGEPQKELASAQDALEKATTAEADRYVSDLFAEAENTLTEAQNLIAQKNYKEAKDLLIKAKTMADSAASLAPTSKENAKMEAEDFISGSQKAMEQLRDTQKMAQNLKIPKEHTDLTIQLPNWEDQLKRAQEQYDQENFDIASKIAGEVYRQISTKDSELRELIMAKQK